MNHQNPQDADAPRDKRSSPGLVKPLSFTETLATSAGLVSPQLVARRFPSAYTPSRDHQGIPPPFDLTQAAAMPAMGSSPERHSSSATTAAFLAANNNNSSFTEKELPTNGSIAWPTIHYEATESMEGSSTRDQGRCTTPILLNQCNIDSAAIDVGGFYDRSQQSGATPLIPNEMPTSTVLYVLTTSEGRDKLFKLLQYFLKMLIAVMYLPNVLPLRDEESRTYWVSRFAGNVQTVRNGRSMFKLGRWIHTVFHLQTVAARLVERYTNRGHSGTSPVCISLVASMVPRVAPMWLSRLRAFVFLPATTSAVPAPPNAGEGVGEDELPLQLSTPLAQDADFTPRRPVGKNVSWAVVDAAIDDASQQLQSASSAMPIHNRNDIAGFPTLGMALIGLRCVSSMVRNIVRDLLFLSTDPFQLSYFSYVAKQGLANKAWFIVSVIDFGLNGYRLLDPAWFQYSKAKGECGCSYAAQQKLRRSGLLFFPRLDLDFGSVAPTTAKFFEAADPSSMLPACKVCRCVLRPDPAAQPLSSSERALGQITPPQQQQQKLFIPWLIRYVFDVTWVATKHENFYHTLLLQLRYACDVYASYGYMRNETLEHQQVPLLGAVAGATSAFAALLRVMRQAR